MTHEHDRQPERLEDHLEWAPADEVQAQRLAEALDVLDAGRDPDVDPREDPELASLLDMAGSLRASLAGATGTTAYRSYRNRSRAVILHALEPKQPANVVPFYRRWTWTSFAPVASAAAAAAVVFAVIGGSIALVGGANGAGETPRNLTAASLEEHFGLLAASVQDIQLRTDRGETVPREMLISIAESMAAGARNLQQQRERGEVASPETVRQRTTAEEVRELLNRTQPEEGGEAALVTAQIATEEFVTAARFLEETPTPEPTAAPTAAATPAPSPTPAEPTVTPSPTETAAPTSSVTETPHGNYDDGEGGELDGPSAAAPSPIASPLAP